MKQKCCFCSEKRRRADTGTAFNKQESNYQIRIMFRFRGGRSAEISEYQTSNCPPERHHDGKKKSNY